MSGEQSVETVLLAIAGGRTEATTPGLTIRDAGPCVEVALEPGGSATLSEDDVDAVASVLGSWLDARRADRVPSSVPLRRRAARCILLQVHDSLGWDEERGRSIGGSSVAQLAESFKHFEVVLAEVAPGCSLRRLLAPLGKGLPGALSALVLRDLLVVQDDVVYLTRTGREFLSKYPSVEV